MNKLINFFINKILYRKERPFQVIINEVKKSDLKSGDVICLEDGTEGVLADTPLGKMVRGDDKMWSSIDYWDEKFNWKRQYEPDAKGKNIKTISRIIKLNSYTVDLEYIYIRPEKKYLLYKKNMQFIETIEAIGIPKKGNSIKTQKDRYCIIDHYDDKLIVE